MFHLEWTVEACCGSNLRAGDIHVAIMRCGLLRIFGRECVHHSLRELVDARACEHGGRPRKGAFFGVRDRACEVSLSLIGFPVGLRERARSAQHFIPELSCFAQGSHV